MQRDGIYGGLEERKGKVPKAQKWADNIKAKVMMSKADYRDRQKLKIDYKHKLHRHHIRVPNKKNEKRFEKIKYLTEKTHLTLLKKSPTLRETFVACDTCEEDKQPQEAAFKAAWPIIKPSFLKPTRGETPVRSTQACFPPIHPKTKISAGLRVDLPSSGSVKKLTGASFLADIPARLNTSKRTSLTMSCRYLKPGRSLQCTACSPNESKHALRQIGHNSSTGKSGINRRYLRMVRYSTGDICWPRPSMGIARRKS
ncbi:hypothetical protein LXL04_026349 [Taraxacum kok-saghyz]